MKPKVLLAGGTGYIGKALSETIEHDAELFVLSKYPDKKETSQIANMTWIKSDIYNYEDVVKAMQDIDIAVFYLDPTKNSAKVTHSTARDLTLLGADNFGRAAALNHIAKIIYIPGSRYDNAIMERLGAYGAVVERTNLEIKRPHVNVELQVSKYDDVRSTVKVLLPKKWTLVGLVNHFITWLNDTKGTLVKTHKNNDSFIIYFKNRNKPLAKFKIEETTEDLITLKLISGSLVKKKAKPQGKLEFRLLKGTPMVMIHLFDYIPKLLFPIYYFVQAPLQKIIIRGFEIDCRIKHFQGRVRAGEKFKYTK